MLVGSVFTAAMNTRSPSQSTVRSSRVRARARAASSLRRRPREPDQDQRPAPRISAVAGVEVGKASSVAAVGSPQRPGQALSGESGECGQGIIGRVSLTTTGRGGVRSGDHTQSEPGDAAGASEGKLASRSRLSGFTSVKI